MGYTPTLIWQLNRNLMGQGGYYWGHHRTWSWSNSSSFTVSNDNINQNCTRYPGLMGACDNINFDWSASGSDDGCRTYWDSRWCSAGSKAGHSWCSTSGINKGELVSYGYIGSYLGGFRAYSWEDPGGYTMTNPGDPGYDILNVYGHGATGPTLNISHANQYRNEASLPADGSCFISTTGSTYARPKGLWPAWYEIRITDTGTAGSGNVKFIYSTRCNLDDIGTNADYRLSDAWLQLESYWWGNQMTKDKMAWILGSSLGVVNMSVNGVDRKEIKTPLVEEFMDELPWDVRTGPAAMGRIDLEYFYIAYSSFLVVYSTKSAGSWVPMNIYDISKLVTRPNKRIAGVAVQDKRVYILTEGGEMVLVDYTTVLGGSITTLPSLPAMGAGWRCAGMVTSQDNSCLWILKGNYALNQWEVSTGSPGATLVKFLTPAHAWDIEKVCPTTNLRVGARSLSGLISSGKFLTFTGDYVTPSKTDIPATPHYLMTRHSAKLNVTQGPGVSIISAIYGRHLLTKEVKNAKMRFTWTNPYNAVVQKATLAWVPAGSPTGTAWVGTEALTFSNNPGFSLNVAGPVVSDPLKTHTMTRDYDYYLITWTPTPITNWECGAAEGYASLVLPTDQTSATTVPAGAYSQDNGWWIFDGVVFDSATDYQVPVKEDPSKNANLKFQVVCYDTITDSWDAQQASQGTSFYPFSRGVQRNVPNEVPIDAYMKSFPTLIAGKNRIIVQGTTSLESLYWYDPAGKALARPTSTQFPPAIPTASAYRPVVFLKNPVCGSILCWVWQDANPDYKYLWTYYIWDEGDMLKAPVLTDQPAHNTWGESTYGLHHRWNPDYWTSSEPWLSAAPFMWTDHVLLTQYAWDRWKDYPTTIDPTRIGIRCWFMPRHYYWDATNNTWAVTASRAKALASPKTVPDHNTLIPISDGLVLKFGPESGTTYTATEYHTLNATWGKIKYTRKAKYATAMFPGKTFTHSDTRAMADMRALTLKSFRANTVEVKDTTGKVVPGATVNGDKLALWPKRTGGAWTVDCNAGVYPVITMKFDTPVNFSDVNLGSWLARGLTWEVSTDGTVFTPITPLWRSHNGRYRTFLRQEGVVAVRLSAKLPGNSGDANFYLGGCIFYDYGPQATIDAARMGSQAAPDNTPARGSWDSGCLGVAPTLYISIDGLSMYFNNPIPHNHVDSWYATTDVPVNRYKTHPYYGFIRFEGPVDTPSTKEGTTLVAHYVWGKKVL